MVCNFGHDSFFGRKFCGFCLDFGCGYFGSYFSCGKCRIVGKRLGRRDDGFGFL